MNLYPDPAITAANYAINGSAISKSDGLIRFASAGGTDAIALEGAIESQFFDLIAVGGQYKVSFNLANVVPCFFSVKLGNGSWVLTSLSADGWTTPVTVTAGSNRSVSFVLKGYSASTFDIVPDANGEAIRITT